MQMTAFLQDKLLTVALSGEIDHHSAKSTLRQIADKIDQYLPNLCVLDFRSVSFMDSSGIAVILKAYRRMREIDGRLWVENVRPQPLRVLDASGIDRLVAVTAQM